MELRISIVQLKPQISLTCKRKAQLCEVFWPLWMLTWWSWMRIHGLVYKNNFNLCIMGVEMLYSEDSKRSCISCSGSLCSEGYEARPLIFFLCTRRWFMCLYYSLNDRNNERRLRNRMKCHSGKHHVTVGFWPLGLRCYFLRVVGTQRLWFSAFLALTPEGGSTFLFYGLWWPVSSVIGKLKIKSKIFPPPF